MTDSEKDKYKTDDEKTHILLDIWEEICGKRIGPNDDFFSFGMDSITLTRFNERILEITDKDIDTSDFFYCTKISDIADLI